MADEKLSTWQECKAIAEALSPAPADPDEAQRLGVELIYSMLAASSPKGAEIAQRMRDANGGPIEGQPGDMEAIHAMGEMLRQRIAEKTGVNIADGQCAVSVSLLKQAL
jgi:hypothetical protein